MASIYMGDLEPWMDEEAICRIWRNLLQHDVNVKLIRDKYSGLAHYGFVEFPSVELAQKALRFNNKPIPGSDRLFKLGEDKGGDDSEYSIFVGDLAPDITDTILLEVFRRYKSCKSAKVMIDPQTQQSRGYGFVRFGSENDQQRTLMEMQGYVIKGRAIRVSTATPKSKSNYGGFLNQFQPQQFHPPSHYQQFQPQNPSYPPSGTTSPTVQGPFYGAPPHHHLNQFTDINNTTVFVGGLSPYVTEDELRQHFQGFGDITYVKIPPGKGCGFVQFVQRQSAEMAITQMQGYLIANNRVRLSWGRSQNQVHGHMGYRAAPQPLIYPQLGITAPSHGHYQPINPAVAHRHPIPLITPAINDQDNNTISLQAAILASGIPPLTGGPLASGEDPSEPVPVARLNELYLAARDGRLDRVESETQGYHGVYAQS